MNWTHLYNATIACSKALKTTHLSCNCDNRVPAGITHAASKCCGTASSLKRLCCLCFTRSASETRMDSTSNRHLLLMGLKSTFRGCCYDDSRPTRSTPTVELTQWCRSKFWKRQIPSRTLTAFIELNGNWIHDIQLPRAVKVELHANANNWRYVWWRHMLLVSRLLVLWRNYACRTFCHRIDVFFQQTNTRRASGI